MRLYVLVYPYVRMCTYVHEDVAREEGKRELVVRKNRPLRGERDCCFGSIRRERESFCHVRCMKKERKKAYVSTYIPTYSQHCREEGGGSV